MSNAVSDLGENDALFSSKKGFTRSRAGGVKSKENCKGKSFAFYSCGQLGHLARNDVNKKMSNRPIGEKKKNQDLQNLRFAEKGSEFTFTASESHTT